jgi:putative flippase GtrA
MRLVKFSCVGAIGIVIQIAVLAVLTHIHLHYLVATVCAVEAAVLHNFCWHMRFTWRDRGIASVWRPLARFHLSNAAISLVGNVVLMRVLVGAFGLRPIVANLVAIAACAVINFLASDHWVFVANDCDAMCTPRLHAAGCGRSRISMSVRCAKGT